MTRGRTIHATAAAALVAVVAVMTMAHDGASAATRRSRRLPTARTNGRTATTRPARTRPVPTSTTPAASPGTTTTAVTTTTVLPTTAVAQTTTIPTTAVPPTTVLPTTVVAQTTTTQPVASAPTTVASIGAAQYLDTVLSLIERSSIRVNRGLADIAAIRTTALAAAATALIPSDVYPVIRDALRALGDRHSSLLDPEAAKRITIGQRTGFGFDRFRDGIVFVYPASPAAIAGLRDLDRIVGVNGRVTASLTLDDANGSTLSLRVIHAGETDPVDLSMGRGEFSTVRLPLFHPLGRHGYLEVPSPVGDSAALNQYIEAGATATRVANAAPPCGWVIDLRRNSGGYPFPMFASIAPLIGDGTFLYQDQPSRRDTWSIGNGRVLVNGVPQTDTGNTTVLRTTDPAVAILTSSSTASAGEAAVIAFAGKSPVRVFGEPTVGVTSTNVAYRLVDGAFLQITTSYDVDRTGRVYDGPIQPDQQAAIDWSTFGTDADALVRSASDWLAQQRSCA